MGWGGKGAVITIRIKCNAYPTSMHAFNHCALAASGSQVDYGYKVVVVWSYLCDGGANAIEVFGTSGGSYVMKVVGRKKEP